MVACILKLSVFAVVWMSGGSEFQSLMVRGIKEFLKQLVRVVCWMKELPDVRLVTRVAGHR